MTELSANETLIDIDNALRAFALSFPAKLALADSKNKLTWHQLDQRLNQTANALIGQGIQANERVAILGRNSVEYATLFLGALRAGICIVPLSTLASSDTLASMINDSGAKLLFVSKDYWGLIEPVANKLKAYKLQEEGRDTVEANLELGFKMDERDYGVGAQILNDLGVAKMKLISNNPKKRAGLIGYGLEITEVVAIEIESNPHNHFYLHTKKEKMGHDLHFSDKKKL